MRHRTIPAVLLAAAGSALSLASGTVEAATIHLSARITIGEALTVRVTGLDALHVREGYRLSLVQRHPSSRRACVADIGTTVHGSGGAAAFSGRMPHRLTCYRGRYGQGSRDGYDTVRPGHTYRFVAGRKTAKARWSSHASIAIAHVHAVSA